MGDSNGDAICLRYGTDQGFDIHVVDGAFAPTAQTIIDHITKYYTADPYIANVVLSHADDDHAPGLIGVLERFKVGTLWMNRPWLHAQAVIDNFHGNWTLEGLVKEMRDRHPYLIDLERVAARRGVTVRDVFQGDQIGPFTVLAPSRDRYIRLIPDLTKTPQSYAEAKRPSGAFGQAAKDLLDRVREYWNVETLDASPPPTSASNETSVVQLGVIDGEKFLLTADVGPEGLLEAAEYARSRGLLGPLGFVQVPHHGSRRNVTPAVLNIWLGTPVENANVKRGVAFCSVGKDADIYPRKKVKNAFMRRGYPVHATRRDPKSHYKGWKRRDGWGNSEPEAFSNDVEDDD